MESLSKSRLIELLPTHDNARHSARFHFSILHLITSAAKFAHNFTIVSTIKMTESYISDFGKPWELVEEFDELQLQSKTSVSQGSIVQYKANDPNPNPKPTLPGMTAEYREFCNSNLHAGIIPLEDLHKLVYNPLKNKFPDKFKGSNQDVEFYSVYTLNGKKFYKKLSGKERDIAVQKDIFEQAKRRKVMDINIQILRFKLEKKRQDLSLIKASCDPVKVFIFENSIKYIEMALDRDDLCNTTMKQLDRLIVFTWILFFEKDMAKKRKKIDLMNLGHGCVNKHNLTMHVTTDQSSKRMKGSPKEAETNPPVNDRGSIASCNSNDDHADSDETETSDWNVDSSDGCSSSE